MMHVMIIYSKQVLIV